MISYFILDYNTKENLLIGLPRLPGSGHSVNPSASVAWFRTWHDRGVTWQKWTTSCCCCCYCCCSWLAARPPLLVASTYRLDRPAAAAVARVLLMRLSGCERPDQMFNLAPLASCAQTKVPSACNQRWYPMWLTSAGDPSWRGQAVSCREERPAAEMTGRPERCFSRILIRPPPSPLPGTHSTDYSQDLSEIGVCPRVSNGWYDTILNERLTEKLVCMLSSHKQVFAKKLSLVLLFSMQIIQKFICLKSMKNVCLLHSWKLLYGWAQLFFFQQKCQNIRFPNGCRLGILSFRRIRTQMVPPCSPLR